MQTKAQSRQALFQAGWKRATLGQCSSFGLWLIKFHMQLLESSLHGLWMFRSPTNLIKITHNPMYLNLSLDNYMTQSELNFQVMFQWTVLNFFFFLAFEDSFRKDSRKTSQVKSLTPLTWDPKNHKTQVQGSHYGMLWNCIKWDLRQVGASTT